MSVYDFTVRSLSGEPTPLAQFQNDVLLIVNTASECGFTPQYAGLEMIYRKYHQQGFHVLAFPCNQFGKQEPGTDRDIEHFCEVNYETTFPLFSKIDVNGAEADPLYQYLKKTAPGVMGSLGIKWNFTKFLVQRDGQTINRYAPNTKPEMIEDDIVQAISVPSS